MASKQRDEAREVHEKRAGWSAISLTERLLLFSVCDAEILPDPDKFQVTEGENAL